MPNAKSTYTFTLTSAGAGISGGSSTFTIREYDPVNDNPGWTTVSASVPYADFPKNVPISNYATKVDITVSYNSFGCSSTDEVSITPTIFRYVYHTPNSNASTACSETSGQGDLYSRVEFSGATLEQFEVTLFTDAALTTAFSGNGQYYKLTPPTGASTAVIINSDGTTGATFGCGA